MTYSVKEMFLTLQGEGAQAGRVAVFCRFSGCNLWSGREQNRAKAVCQFCDTDFVGTDGPGGNKFANAALLVDAVMKLWPDSNTQPYIVCTGGEPALQLDKELIDAFHRKGCLVAVETNGSLELPEGIDWICVSPKKGAELVLTYGDELKLVYPQGDFDPEQFESHLFHNFYLQPMDNERAQQNLLDVIEYCQAHPKWKLSVQMHKVIGIP